MSDLRDLYQEVILDHARHPRNCYEMSRANRKAEGYNPLCGDRVTLYLQLENNIIQSVSFMGQGCAISTASVSMLTDFLKGKTVQEAEDYFSQFHQLVTKEDRNLSFSGLGKLSIFKGVHEFPIRVKCATLAWHTLKAALQNKTEPISTE